MSKQIGKIKRFSVTFVEYGDSVDGKARILGIYEDRKFAVGEMHMDAMRYYKAFDLDRIEMFNDSASVGSTDECGCEWRIDEVEIPVYEGEIENET